MLLAPHVLAGLVVAKYEPGLLPEALSAVTIHFVLDAIPHTDMIGGSHINLPNFILRSFDVGLTIALFFWLVPEVHWITYATVAIFAVLPDLVELPGLIWKKWWEIPGIKQFHHWHTAILQYNRPKVGWVMGLLPQIILGAVCIFYLKFQI